MNTYKIESLPIHFAKNNDEMKQTFSELLNGDKCKISFINPEIFLQQKKNTILKDYFLSCKYNFIDGIGLLYAINNKFGTNYGSDVRYPGTDFFEYLPEKKINIFLYGSKSEFIEKAIKEIENKYPNVKVVDYFDGYTQIDDSDLVQKINNANVDILIVCKGCPKQENWIIKNFDSLNVKIVFGNGGAIDFWSGNVKRAPKFMINHGLEFIFRLFQDFTLTRIKRQLKLIGFLINYKLGKYKIEKDF